MVRMSRYAKLYFNFYSHDTVIESESHKLTYDETEVLYKRRKCTYVSTSTTVMLIFHKYLFNGLLLYRIFQRFANLAAVHEKNVLLNSKLCLSSFPRKSKFKCLLLHILVVFISKTSSLLNM